MLYLKRISLFLIISLLSVVMLMPAQAGNSIIVTTDADSGEGSLREAILTANANGGGTIRFMIDAPRPYVIQLESGLPEITAPVVIDGEAQCATETTPSEMRVVIDGSLLSAGDGLYLTADAQGSIIRGLAIGGFADGAGIYVDGATGVQISCNHLGVNAAGDDISPNDTGIYAVGDDLNLNIGAINSPADRNVLSGNTRYGARVTHHANISYNFVGVDATGQFALENGLSGIFFDASAGGTVEGNVVSGNGEMGILIDGASEIDVIGNLVGTNAEAVASIPNGLSGIYVRESYLVNILGRNVASGNTEMGILIRSSNAVVVTNNYVGTSLNGDFAVPNGFSGMGVSAGSFDVTIGGELGSSGNVISGNTQIGIRISDEGTRNVVVIGNFIGTDPTGTYAIPNQLSGVYVREGAYNNQIGTGAYPQRNVVSGNMQAGVVANASYDNRVQGNFIGTDITGTYAIPNQFSGVSIEGGATNNRIGGDFAGAGNLISGNNELGVYLADEGTSGNIITGNYIGVDITGTYALPNGYSGVGAFDGATNTQVGGLLPSERNLISGNGQFGVALNGAGAVGMTIFNNLIGTDTTGTIALPNLYGGVVIENGASSAIIGGSQPEARNVISGNSYSGVSVRDVGTSDVQIIGNFIGSDISGQKPLGNAINGIRLNGLAELIQIGSENRGTGNLVAFNGSHGIYIDNVLDTTITGNAILSNDGAGVYYFDGDDAGVTLGRNDFKRNCQNPPEGASNCEDVTYGTPEG